ncbi:hypothetical protein LTR35_000797 [Friedmanniomyces endolithicus]|uniref:Uncharacterized protein n=1 Tax=Friedmanniomyces endolithicus TaxID=329885 RepID=A0AAN6FVV3_9PEZI|nr:hypothetical protein LTS00_012492 [Friedmanniomyces endolithicus]KAK0292766.1 hypothetical protein LTR35_000797 [Friedmanniomyces endolithicus]KAK0323278.1 hypothetical protein LTR82_005638 [Friedmanniomyces endolithicus]KAK1013584.1 hypothetical protein LTR54_004491 [Friedmanniomyces endolithicus]
MDHYCSAAANSPTKFANFREDFFDSKDEVDEPDTPHDGLVCTVCHLAYVTCRRAYAACRPGRTRCEDLEALIRGPESPVEDVVMIGVTIDTGGYGPGVPGSPEQVDDGFGGSFEGMHRTLRSSNEKKIPESDPIKVRVKSEAELRGSLSIGATFETSAPTPGQKCTHDGRTTASTIKQAHATSDSGAERVAGGTATWKEAGAERDGGPVVNDGYKDGWLILQAVGENYSGVEGGEERAGEPKVQGDYVDDWLKLSG